MVYNERMMTAMLNEAWDITRAHTSPQVRGTSDHSDNVLSDAHNKALWVSKPNWIGFAREILRKNPYQSAARLASEATSAYVNKVLKTTGLYVSYPNAD